MRQLWACSDAQGAISVLRHDDALETYQALEALGEARGDDASEGHAELYAGQALAQGKDSVRG